MLGESGLPEEIAALDKTLPVTGIAMLGEEPQRFMFDFPGLLRNVPVLEHAAAGRGLFTIRPERDGIIRRVPMIMQAQGQTMPSLTFEILRVASGSGTILIKAEEGGIKSIGVKGYQIPTDHNGQLWIHYARNDSHYLKPLADLLRAQLQEKARLSWQEESCARLIQECARPQPVDPDQVWRVKGADKLDRRGLAVLRELWNWRDSEAVTANRPPYFVVRHEALVALADAAARQRPVSSLLPPRLSARRREGLFAALERAWELPPAQLPHRNRPSGHRPSLAERRRLDLLRQRRDRCAAELGIDPTLIASRATLTALAGDRSTDQADLMKWQRELLQG